jgi:hypothetical protein
MVTEATVRNLKNMIFAEHVEANGFPNQQQQQTMIPPIPQQFPNMGVPRFGGFAQPPTLPDPNAPKHTLDGETRAALAKVFSQFGDVKPKAFGGKGGK